MPEKKGNAFLPDAETPISSQKENKPSANTGFKEPETLTFPGTQNTDR